MKITLYSIAVFTLFLASCHSPNKNNLNEEASIHSLEQLPENPLLLIPMSFSINPKQKKMSTLYGNKIAMHYAQQKEGNVYPSGSLLYEVTWEQKADSLWYGANIPGKISKIERIKFTEKEPEYSLYSGFPLRKNQSQDAAERITAIVSQPLAVSP
ncbi:hypothetical protein EV144_10417 [Flavobacterium sp. 270]|uniref:cytochrome P460 family protein n=1 Tax=Flavobacterium sp. 270 TaxID=2512114 RepID=UPI0010654648|nr:cytochrome P460 family protein [Flavobacterium sp. 270]TDW47735.1 hypothetical protein EV144_10417 [Flavobacterium sp. 270]